MGHTAPKAVTGCYWCHRPTDLEEREGAHVLISLFWRTPLLKGGNMEHPTNCQRDKYCNEASSRPSSWPQRNRRTLTMVAALLETGTQHEVSEGALCCPPRCMYGQASTLVHSTPSSSYSRRGITEWLHAPLSSSIPSRMLSPIGLVNFQRCFCHLLHLHLAL